MRFFMLAAALLTITSRPVNAPSDGRALVAQTLKTYPSLLYVDRYREMFPAEVQGKSPFWKRRGAAPYFSGPGDLVRSLAALQDVHVALVGPKAGKPETLGVLFRSSSDGQMVVWRIFDAAVRGLRRGDQLVAIDGVPTRTWLTRAAASTFGGNRRSRYAEAALDLALGTTIVHKTAKLGKRVALRFRRVDGGYVATTIAYRPMDERRASALAAAVNLPDLPSLIRSPGTTFGSIRIGAFAPQYDPLFISASERASHKPGSTDDEAMQAGYCAVVRSFISRFQSVAQRSDAVVLDLRGNLGGFDRLARLEANAIARTYPPRTFDLFATGAPQRVRLTEQRADPACGHTAVRRPIVVLIDAGTRSSGELMAAWLWVSGAIVVGERTIGAGGGFEYATRGFALPDSGFYVRTSQNFTVFDPTLGLNDGVWPERTLVDRITADRFTPSRNRPFSIQAVGLRPDVPLASTLTDLRDGGVAEITSAMPRLRLRQVRATQGAIGCRGVVPCNQSAGHTNEESANSFGITATGPSFSSASWP